MLISKYLDIRRRSYDSDLAVYTAANIGVMEWLNVLISRGLLALGVDTSLRFGGSLQFFLYDTIKIVTLWQCWFLFISWHPAFISLPNAPSSAVAGVSRLLPTVWPLCRERRWLFCSARSPLSIGFTAGLPLSVTFPFWFRLVDLGSLVLISEYFGAKVAGGGICVGWPYFGRAGRYYIDRQTGYGQQ